MQGLETLRVFDSKTASHTKCIFSAKCNSRPIAIQWFHIKLHPDYQYTKVQLYTSRVLGLHFFHDTLFGFPDYSSAAVVAVKMKPCIVFVIDTLLKQAP